jgi:hypothetical protein
MSKKKPWVDNILIIHVYELNESTLRFNDDKEMIKPSKMPSILFVMSHFVELKGSYVCVGYVENIGYI